MASRAGQLIAWASASFVISGLLFGLVAAFAFSVDPEPAGGADLSSWLLIQIALYGVFHWFLLGLLTLPILVAPVLAWPRLSRAVPSVERSRLALVAMLGLLAVAAIAVRALLLEYPVLLTHPSSLFRSWNYFNESVALWLGLVVPRLAIGPLGLGTFLSKSEAV